MAFATLNGRPVFDGQICIPRFGAWTADLTVDNAQTISGACDLAFDGGLTFAGTAHRSGVWLDTGRLRIVAGADGLLKTAKPKHYVRPIMRTILADLVATAGERISSTASASILATTFGMWATMALPVGRIVSALIADQRLPAATAWRMLTDGSLWVGTETWPDSGLRPVIDWQDLEEFPEAGRLEIGVETPTLLPGTLLDGRRVSYVEYHFNGSAARATVLVET